MYLRSFLYSVTIALVSAQALFCQGGQAQIYAAQFKQLSAQADTLIATASRLAETENIGPDLSDQIFAAWKLAHRLSETAGEASSGNKDRKVDLQLRLVKQATEALGLSLGALADFVTTRERILLVMARRALDLSSFMAGAF